MTPLPNAIATCVGMGRQLVPFLSVSACVALLQLLGNAQYHRAQNQSFLNGWLWSALSRHCVVTNTPIRY